MDPDSKQHKVQASSPSGDDSVPESSVSSPDSVCDSLHSVPEGATASIDKVSSSPSSVKPPPSMRSKEKRKRSRVTPDQLQHLERFFAADRSPTAARRKEISDLLGMHERQTQIWFQNRRAKAKLQGGKIKGRADPPLDTPPELCAGFEIDLYNLIHEDEPITVIPCTDLSIGTWRRVASTVSKHDLVGYVCPAKRCITWFIHSSGLGFKIEIPFDTVVDTQFRNISPGIGLATLKLSQPPSFYLEQTTPSLHGSPLRYWKRCADWTEGTQATKVLRHEVVGSAVQLAYILRTLSPNGSGSGISLYSPQCSGTSPVLHPPSLFSTRDDGYRNDTTLHNPRMLHAAHSRPPFFKTRPLMLNRPLQNLSAHPPYPHLAEASPSIHAPPSFDLYTGDSRPPQPPLQLEAPFDSSRRMTPALQSLPPIPRFPSAPSAYTSDCSPRSASPYDYPTDPPSSASTASQSSFESPSPQMLKTPFLAHWGEPAVALPATPFPPFMQDCEGIEDAGISPFGYDPGLAMLYAEKRFA